MNTQHKHSRIINDSQIRRTSQVEAREDMAVAAAIGGIALANAKLGTVSAFNLFHRSAGLYLCATLVVV